MGPIIISFDPSGIGHWLESRDWTATGQALAGIFVATLPSIRRRLPRLYAAGATVVKEVVGAIIEPVEEVKQESRNKALPVPEVAVPADPEVTALLVALLAEMRQANRREADRDSLARTGGLPTLASVAAKVNPATPFTPTPPEGEDV